MPAPRSATLVISRPFFTSLLTKMGEPLAQSLGEGMAPGDRLYVPDPVYQGGTDHLSFDAVGLPGFQYIQDPMDYETRTHHSDMDTFDRLHAADLQQAAVIEAIFLYNTSEREAMKARFLFALGYSNTPVFQLAWIRNYRPCRPCYLSPN